MTAFNQKILDEDDTGHVESCDCCNALIYNWGWMGWSFVSFDGRKILCLNCWNDERKQIVIDNLK